MANLKVSEQAYPSTRYTEAAAPSTPAAGEVIIYAKADGNLYQKDDAGTETSLASAGGAVATDAIWDAKGDLAGGTGANTAAKLSVGANDTVLTADSSQSTGMKWATPAASDIIATMFGAADTAFEFNTSSLSGLTALSTTPDAEDANTTVPGHYYIADNASSASWCGRYITIPSYPFTAMIKVSAWNPKGNFNSVGIFLSVTTPGKMHIHNAGLATRVTRDEIFTNPTTFSSTQGTGTMDKLPNPFYLALTAASTSSVTSYTSMDGISWERVVSASNPSMTIGSVGFAIKSENSSGLAVAIDWFRVWNSSKTFLTGI